MQLIVRLTHAQRASLEAALAHRTGAAGSISKLVRQALSTLLDPNHTQQVCYVSPELHQALLSLSNELGRSTDQILSECIMAVAELGEHPEAKPLIVQEVKLRRAYRDEAKPAN